MEQTFTDITDEDDFGVGGDVLCEEGSLVFKGQELMLTGRICFARSGGCQVKEVKPALCTHSNHQVLTNNTHTQCWEHHHLNIQDKLLLLIYHFTSLPFLYCTHLQLQHRSAGKPTHITGVKKTNSLYEIMSFYPSDLVTVLTMPTQVLVIQGLESSFL